MRRAMGRSGTCGAAFRSEGDCRRPRRQVECCFSLNSIDYNTMLHRNLMARIAGACAAASIAIMAASSAHAAPADDLRDAQKLYGQGKLQPALEKDEAYLREQPRDP